MPTEALQPVGGAQFGESDGTTPSSGLAIQFDLDAMPLPMDSLGAMIDIPMNFDWVCQFPMPNPAPKSLSVDRMFSTITFVHSS